MTEGVETTGGKTTAEEIREKEIKSLTVLVLPGHFYIQRNAEVSIDVHEQI